MKLQKRIPMFFLEPRTQEKSSKPTKIPLDTWVSWVQVGENKEGITVVCYLLYL